MAFSQPCATRALAEGIARLDYDNISDQALLSAKRCLLEIISGAVAGRTVSYIGQMDARMPESASSEATVIGGDGRRRSAEQAAMLNASAAVVREFIGGHRFSYSMPVIAAVPAALAAAERAGASGRTLLAAMVAGIETHARIGMAVLPMKQAFHPHGTVAVFGAAAAAAGVEGLDARMLEQVFNIAAVLPVFGHRRTTFEGGTVRNFYPGFTAYNGMTAVKLAQSGVIGVEDGIRTCFCDIAGEDGLHEDVLLDGLGTRFETARNYYKLHGCDRHLHGAVEVTERLMQEAGEGGISPDDVDRIEVETYLRASRCGSKNPVNALASQWSIPHGIAAMLILHRSDAEAYSEEAVARPDIRALARRVEVRENPAFTALEPGQRPTRVTMFLKDGRRLSGEVAIASGEFDSGEPDAVLEHKLLEKCFSLFRSGGVARESAERITDCVMRLERIADVRELTGMLGVSPSGLSEKTGTSIT